MLQRVIDRHEAHPLRRRTYPAARGSFFVKPCIAIARFLLHSARTLC